MDSSEALKNAAETKALLNAVQGLDFKKIFWERWKIARKYAGVPDPNAPALRTKDTLEIRQVLNPEFVQGDGADRALLVGQAFQILQNEYSGKIDFEESPIGYYFNIGKPRFDEVFFKFYCHACSKFAKDIVLDFVREFIKISEASLQFKITDDPESASTEGRFIIYAPINTNAAGAVARVLRRLPSEYFFPGRHMFGIPITGSIAAVLNDPNIDDFNCWFQPRIEEAYEAMLKVVPGLDEEGKFDFFYDVLKGKLAKSSHFAHM